MDKADTAVLCASEAKMCFCGAEERVLTGKQTYLLKRGLEVAPEDMGKCIKPSGICEQVY